MFIKTCFRQNCPVCGRPLRISVDLLGKDVACQNCGGRFLACDPTSIANADAFTLSYQLLLVQPNRDQLAMLTRSFTEHGYRVTPVFHPRQALEAATFKDFDAAVVDGSLPEIDGVELCYRLNRRIRRLRTVLTVEPDYGVLKTSPPEGIRSVLQKPFSVEHLKSVVDEAVRLPEFQEVAITDKDSLSLAEL